MTSRLKSLPALFLALALCSALAPAASADFNSEAVNTKLTVSANDTQSFKLKAGSAPTIECTTLTFNDATVVGTTVEAVTISPTYHSCENFLGAAVAVNTNGCDYTLHLMDSSTGGVVDLECPSTSGIEISVGSICKYKISTQTGVGVIAYSNTGTSTTREIVAQPNSFTITSTRTTSDLPFICPAGSTEGTYTGGMTITGENAGSHVGIFVD